MSILLVVSLLIAQMTVIIEALYHGSFNGTTLHIKHWDSMNRETEAMFDTLEIVRVFGTMK